MATKKKGGSHKTGRDSGTGKFIPVEEAKRRPQTTEVERIPNRTKKK